MIRRRASGFAQSLAFVLFAALLAIGPACERSNQGPASTARSPRETVAALIEARDAAAYDRMRDMILPDRGEPVIRTLRALDRFLQSNRALREYVHAEISGELAAAVDQSHLFTAVDIFSPAVEIVDETITGDSAEVSFAPGGRVPLKRTTLRKIDGRWRYDPGDGYDASLPEAFDRMADGLLAVLADLKSGRLPREAIRTNPDALLSDVRARLLPGIKLLKRPDSAKDEPPR